MDIVWVSLAALLASCLTFFSGFGLGTLLMPVVALFLPIEVAVAVTAVVHLANNVFKFALVGRHAVRDIVLRFGVPAVIAALFGALLLNALSGFAPIATYTLGTKIVAVTWLKVLMGLLILFFVWFELSPHWANHSIDARYLPLGGVLSGFFGGLSGHQGAFRSLFLLKAGLNQTQYVATGVVIAVLVDVGRMLVYGWHLSHERAQIHWTMVVSASVCAFLGAYVGAKVLHKVTLTTIQRIVSVLLVIIGVGLVSGLL